MTMFPAIRREKSGGFMGKEKGAMPGSGPAWIDTKAGFRRSPAHYPDVTAVLATALVKAGYEVVLATPTVDPASDAVAHFGADEATG
ncbi:hypothetical protein [Ancylobacter terrae]|uniref:hypothetical protein n=1 Tax=Ancylobacter sp. sgz301288 TaxID=3342077 RepID=UPI00385D3519